MKVPHTTKRAERAGQRWPLAIAHINPKRLIRNMTPGIMHLVTSDSKDSLSRTP
jgi:hypothetical protein